MEHYISSSLTAVDLPSELLDVIRDVTDAVTVDVPVEFKHVEIVCLDLTFQDTVCRVICFCRKPGFSDVDAVYIKDCVTCLQRLYSTEKLVVVTGDCNLPEIDWSYYYAPNAAVYDAFIDFVNRYGFCQYVNEPTRNGNILDIVMATSVAFVEDLAISVPLGTSDHNTVILKPTS